MQGNENRRKGEVVRQLIDKMICRFDDDSRELIDVEIIPKTGHPWSSQRNYGTAWNCSRCERRLGAMAATRSPGRTPSRTRAADHRSHRSKNSP